MLCCMLRRPAESVECLVDIVSRQCGGEIADDLRTLLSRVYAENESCKRQLIYLSCPALL